MRVAAKTTSASLFKSPVIPFTLVKDKKKHLVSNMDKIDWPSLTESELRLQSIKCVNALWEEEKEGNITRSDIEPGFYSYLSKKAYSKTDIKHIKKLKEYVLNFSILVTGWLLDNGMINPEIERTFTNKINQLIILGKNIVEEDKKGHKVPKKNIQEAMKNKLSDIIGELQGFEDELKPDILKWLQTNNIPKVYIEPINDFFKPHADELTEAILGEDEQLKAAYSPYTKKQLKNMLAWYENLFTDLEAYGRVKQAQRKVRVSKPKSPTKLVAKLKYMHYYDEYKISSIKPETIVGSSTLWLFNTKSRKLCVYNASELDKELTVKGSTILGWDPKTSIGKTLRNPEVQLKDFLGCGKVAMRNFLKPIKAKETKMNGRINKYMLLLKVY